jgi:hypothetical protein
MTDIATRYMRLVEKRPELAATLKGSPIGVRVDDFGTPWWTVDDNGWTIETDNGDEQMHALIFAKLVGAAPIGFMLHHMPEGWVPNVAGGLKYHPKTMPQPSPIEALLAFWEGQL